MALLITPQGLIPYSQRTGVGAINSAAATFRVPGPEYKALITRSDQDVDRVTITAGTTLQVRHRSDRHSLRIKNVGVVPLRVAKSATDAASGADFLDLLVGQERFFDIHYSGEQQVTPIENRRVFHCEWSDDIYVRNPDAVNDGSVEIFEVY